MDDQAGEDCARLPALPVRLGGPAEVLRTGLFTVLSHAQAVADRRTKTMALDLEGQGRTAVAPRRSVVVHDSQKVAVGPSVEPVEEPPRQSWAS